MKRTIDREFLKGRTNESATGCWEWSRGRHRQGYGELSVDGKMKLAHRVAYETMCGPIPDGMKVCHTCDNPPCINPEHLFLGTQLENVRDCVSKLRFGNPLSPDQKAEIRRLREAGVSPRDVAERFNVSQSRVAGIIKVGSGRGNHHRAKLDAAKVRAIRAARAGGAKRRELAEAQGVSLATVDKVISGRAWGWIT